MGCYTAALTIGVLHQGAYRRTYFQPFAALMLLGVVALGLHRLPRRRTFMAAGALMGPMVLSAVFNGPVATRALAGPVSLGVGVLGALGLAGRLGAGAKAVLHGILCSVGLGVALTSWWGVAFRRYPWGLEADGLWRGSSVLTYANTTAAVLVGLSLAAAAWVCGTRRKSLLGFGYRVLLFVLLLCLLFGC